MYLTQGAEAIVLQEEGIIIKERIQKRYRIKVLDDKIRKERTRAEARLISETRRLGIPTPIIYDIQNFKIEMEYIDGEPLKNVINPELSKRVGELTGLLHNGGIIHGDLTTSNLILKDGRIYFIDFGLAFIDRTIEAQGVDVHVLFQTFESTHEDHEKLINAFCDGYRQKYILADKVLKRVKDIEKRGRYA
ncbi:Mn2+dependent serine/threonine protein kinase [Methanohalobium evestigatum Z-7303]|uniref:non-specific serine/threonine protein kinase n=1 Tax=Methanohalobium evestigatum (strain ATCC BAA-1072 / DSM 3721 / NBRC 107634 / OCM 161 / Z-7303) TaxID=644295 RepID=D7EAY6_METEZ|nr:Kae1-associated kinase Bud32 [Methanohalobium evestigatum]ADI74503.1 Mn2+dependent serine/threonine protein kinase [Methanohalobium evestigatum Z-7303]